VFSRALTVTDELLGAFLSISGDDNPLHTDESFARAQGFRGRVAYGNLIALMISSLVGVEMKSLNAMLISETLSFRQPVYCGDTISLTATVASKVDAMEVAELKYRADNQAGELVASGKIMVKFL
jgi:acyl dehydratase